VWIIIQFYALVIHQLFVYVLYGHVVLVHKLSDLIYFLLLHFNWITHILLNVSIYLFIQFFRLVQFTFMLFPSFLVKWLFYFINQIVLNMHLFFNLSHIRHFLFVEFFIDIYDVCNYRLLHVILKLKYNFSKATVASKQ